MRKILLAVGDTATAVQTARQIRPWLKERDTALTLISVVTSSPLSPFSSFKRALEQAEAVFTSAEEQPGIILRVGNNPASELCHEAHQGQYHLLALGLHEGTIGATCRALLNTCAISMWITPPSLHVGMAPQIMIRVDQAAPISGMTDWIAAQCHAQGLNAVLLAQAPEHAAPLRDTLDKLGIRSQVIVRSPIDAATIHAQAQDRRVRWIVLPQDHSRDAASREMILELLSRASCPVLLAQGSAHPAPAGPN